VSKRLLILACAVAFGAAACSSIPNPSINPGSGTRFVPQVVDFVDDAGLGNQVVTDKDGVPFTSYWIFPAAVVPGALPISRPIGAPYIRTLATASAPSQDGSAIGIASLGDNGIWTRGAAAQVQDTPPGIVVPYGPVTDPHLLGETRDSTNGTSMVVDASGNMDVVWTGSEGVYYATAATGGPFTEQRIFNYGYSLTLAGPISRPSIAVDPSGRPWVAYTVIATGVQVRVATLKGTKWVTKTVAVTKVCNACPSPRAPKIVVTPNGPMVAYADTKAHTVDVAQLVKGAWVSHTVASNVAAEGLSLAAGKDKVYLSYYDGSGAVQLQTYDGSTWTATKIADATPPSVAASPVGSASSSNSTSTSGNFEPTTGVAVDDNGLAYVTWYDGTTDQIHLATVDSGTVNLLQTQDTESGAYPSVAVKSDGSRVYLAWYAQPNQDLLFGIYGDVSGQAVAAPSPAPSVLPPSGAAGCGDDGKVQLNEVAQNLTFKNTCLVADSGKPVSINFDNTDSGTIHNIAVSKSSTYSSFIFTGAAVTGPNKTTYDVSKAPLAPGTYFFRCDYHPTSMFGQLVVVKGK
jgi:plastocyanin